MSFRPMLKAATAKDVALPTSVSGSSIHAVRSGPARIRASMIGDISGSRDSLRTSISAWSDPLPKSSQSVRR
ncbi:unannotated protein [freshwater metagenome]|uniref:Unannotated protein n=1 Tax=freshwater metagenome TaxID=449393 RepID=A0A6J7BZU7_9ZZZZ